MLLETLGCVLSAFVSLVWTVAAQPVLLGVRKVLQEKHEFEVS